MPGIWNINNGYNINSKKISSKLSFDVGEKFTGRVVAKGEDKDVTIKLSDGWQFIAEVDGRINFEELKLIKFQVDGFENGKLKLKVVNEDKRNDSEVDENFQEIIEKEGLSQEDVSILKKMVNHNITLTKDNIHQIKGLLQFNQKINIDPDEAKKFIDKYIASKNIEANSEEGQKIRDTLNKFFNEFKNMSDEDIFIFIENNLDFSAENIESFNKLFKGDSPIEKILQDIKGKLDSLNIDNDVLEALKNKANISEELEKKLGKNLENSANTSIASKIYSKNDPMNTKVDVLDLLKTLASNGENDEVNLNSNAQKSTTHTIEGLENLDKSLVDKLQDKELIDNIKSIVGNSNISDGVLKTQASSLIESANKAKLEEFLSKLEGKNIKLTSDEFRVIKEYVNKNSNGSTSGNYESFTQKTQSSAVDTFNMKNVTTQFSGADKFRGFNSNLAVNNISSPELLKETIKDKINDVRDIVKGLVSHMELNDSGIVDKVMNTVKGNLNDFKVFNSISNEYYYLNFNINAQHLEYPCQLIIKDNRKDGKKIDTTNTKMVVSVKTANLGEIDGYVTLRNKSLDVNLKCDSKFADIINNHKKQLSNGLSSLGLLANVYVSSKQKEVDISSCREFFADITISAIDTKV